MALVEVAVASAVAVVVAVGHEVAAFKKRLLDNVTFAVFDKGF